MIFYFLKELYPLPHGSDLYIFPLLTAFNFQFLNPEIASGFSYFLIPLFWVCKGMNLFCFCKLYFKKLLSLFKIFTPPFPGCKGKNLFCFCNFYFNFFFTPQSNIALPFFAGCKGMKSFDLCKTQASYFTIKVITHYKSAWKISLKNGFYRQYIETG